MTNLSPTTSRVNIGERSNDTISGILSKKPEGLSNIVVMSGSAKRRRLQTDENPGVKIVQKQLKDSFLKLRAPFYKTHQRHSQTEEKLMTKSCEILFECIKPYKEIRVSRKSHVMESTRTIGSILTTDIIYERKATRKVEFVSFSRPMQNLPFRRNPTPAVMTTSSMNSEALLETGDDCPDFHEVEPEESDTGRTVSSEDFITNVF